MSLKAITFVKILFLDMVDANLNELETPPGENFPKKLPFSGMVSPFLRDVIIT